jgi:hypothetical protein
MTELKLLDLKLTSIQVSVVLFRVHFPQDKVAITLRQVQNVFDPIEAHMYLL